MKRTLLLYAVACGMAWAGPRRVIVIGVDGLGGAAIEQAWTPNLHALMERGSWTLKARAVIPTVSSPNWASMIMGATPAHHGVTSNDWEPNKFDLAPTCKGLRGTFPTVFAQLRQDKPKMRIGIVHDWTGYGRLVEPKTADLLENVKGSEEATKRAVAWWLESKPDLLFLHLDDVDHAGHDKGWWTKEYFEAVSKIDGLVGRVLAAVRQAGLESSTMILVTADHGGQAKSHGGLSAQHVEIPWIAAGPGVPKGREIRTVVNTYDTASTLGKWFGVKPNACWIGKPVL